MLIRSYCLPIKDLQIIHPVPLQTMLNTFGKDIIPHNDTERLKALQYYDIIGDLKDSYFHNLGSIVAQTFDTPIALISFVEKEKVSFKVNVGMEGTNEVDRGISLCSLAILDNDPTIFSDATKEPCLINNPLVAGEFGLKFYAGAPITTPDGYNIGTLCIVDFEPREFSEKETEILVDFAKVAMQEIIARKEILSGVYQ
jgi:GAF domain-containing protein